MKKRIQLLLLCVIFLSINVNSSGQNIAIEKENTKHTCAENVFVDHGSINNKTNTSTKKIKKQKNHTISTKTTAINNYISTFGIDSTIYVPDGPNCPVQCYQSNVLISGYDSLQTINTVNDLVSFCFTMEHSFLGDLQFKLICPNGQSTTMHGFRNNGSSTNNGVDLGQAIAGSSTACEGNPALAGIGWNYCWSLNTNLGFQYRGTSPYYIYQDQVGICDSTNRNNNTNYYRPFQSFSNLIGCPLNGTWSIEVCDNWGVDDGWIFNWQISILPSSVLSFDVINGNGTLGASINSSNISSGLNISHGTTIEFLAVPDIGYRVKEWKLNNNTILGNTSNNYSLTHTETSTVSVEFELIPANSHIVTYSVVNGNGDLSASTNGFNFSSNYAVLDGENVSFTALPDAGFRVKEWMLNGNLVAGNTSNIFEINNLQEDINVTVEYEEIPNYNITFSVVGGNGTLIAEVEGITIISGTAVIENMEITFTATPNSNYGVKEWRLNNSIIPGNTSNTFSIVNLQENSDVTVEFRVDDVGISNNENPSIHIYPNPSTAIFYIQSDHQYKMEVIDIQGRILINKQIEKGMNELDMSIHNDGVYFMRLSNSDGMHVLKINKIGK